LIGERFAAARGHNNQRVAPFLHIGNDLALEWFKCVVSKSGFENGFRGKHVGDYTFLVSQSRLGMFSILRLFEVLIKNQATHAQK